jgi:FKBP-type peptidyl-prolyl cis-trans isomerase
MAQRSKIVLALIFILTGACNKGDFKIGDSGLSYKFIEENTKNSKAQIGEILTLKLRYTDIEGNEIEESSIFRIQLAISSHKGGSIEDALAMMHKGDSAVFIIDAINYYTQTRKVKAPENFSDESKLIFYIRLIDITPFDEFSKDTKTSHISNQREEELLLKKYIDENAIVEKNFESGLYFLVINDGTGNTPVPGKKVKVHYKGYFIDGIEFDSSYERNEPFEFNYGIGQVIQGWDEAVSKMKVGGKYKLIIPSYLAYGETQHGPIPPYSTLIFEIELLEAEK